MPDYEELINKISLLHGPKEDDDYLYKKDVYIDETAVSAEQTPEQVTPTVEQPDDFELPDIDEEEVPDFLKGEEIEKF